MTTWRHHRFPQCPIAQHTVKIGQIYQRWLYIQQNIRRFCKTDERDDVEIFTCFETNKKKIKCTSSCTYVWPSKFRIGFDPINLKCISPYLMQQMCHHLRDRSWSHCRPIYSNRQFPVISHHFRYCSVFGESVWMISIVCPIFYTGRSSFHVRHVEIWFVFGWSSIYHWIQCNCPGNRHHHNPKSHRLKCTCHCCTVLDIVSVFAGGID